MKKALVLLLLLMCRLTIYSESCNIKYWFDGNLEDCRICETSITDIDISSLSDGMHSLHLYAEVGGKLSHIETRYFVKISQEVENLNESINCKYWFDGNLEDCRICETSITDIDISSLSDGMHSLHLYAEVGGKLSHIETRYFVKIAPTNIETDKSKCVFFIDGVKYGSEYEIADISDASIHFDLNVSDLSNGIHQLSYYIKDNNGKITRRNSSFFTKTPIGGNGISRWKYMLNGDNTTDNVITLKNNVDTLNIITLLPVKSVPIRSLCYNFSIENGKPIIYAKNDIEFWFWDTQDKCVGFRRQYIDENVCQELKVDEMPVLQSNVITRVNRPTENEIKWYKFEAEEGDSLALNADKACTIDIFSPTGKPIYTASGAESVSPSGTHLYETGTFYVGVHDMTAKYGNEINLNFQLIDKYAVLSQDVRKVGNGGISTISFNGNGYLYLNSISIDNGNTIIKDFDIKYKSNTEIEATFDFNGAELGKYDITLHFVDDELKLSNALTVETAKEITLTNNVEFDTQFLRGTSSEYTVTVTNNGNMTAYKVPIYVYVETPLTELIPPIKMNGFDLPGVLDGVDLSEFSQNDIKYLQEKVAEIRDGLYFNKFKTISKETGDSILVQSNYFFVEIPPYSTKTYTISINSDQAISCYVTTPEEWIALMVTEGGAYRNNIKTLNYASDWYCCYKEQIECVLTVVGNISELVSMCVPEGTPASVVSDVISCATSTLGYVSSFAGTAMCNKEEVEKNLYDKAMAASNSISVVDYVKDCLLKKILDKFSFGKIAEIWEIISNLNSYTLQHVDTTVGCITAFTEKKPNCPPIPPQGGKSTPVNSLDPNDIHGYVAESGSRYVGKNVKTVNYMIEFENDSTFATASAHKIELIDTLDVNTLDISSIVPKKIKIGEYEYPFKDNNNGVATIDLRPNINAIAQVAVNVSKNGVLNCEIISLDPMTMEPTDDIMAGILPVNDSEGRGQGYFTFNIGLKEGMADGTEISNKSDIIFDSNEPISTPYWINETDYVDPVSKIDTIECVSDTIVNLRFSGEDNRSGIWRYTLYVQPGDGSDWFLAKENIEADSCEYKVYPEINYGFCVVATDSAGNVEEKQFVRGYSYCNGVATSGLQDVSRDNEKVNFIDNSMYDLLGRKVVKPSQGVYIKRNRKILVK